MAERGPQVPSSFARRRYCDRHQRHFRAIQSENAYPTRPRVGACAGVLATSLRPSTLETSTARLKQRQADGSHHIHASTNITVTGANSPLWLDRGGSTHFGSYHRHTTSCQPMINSPQVRSVDHRDPKVAVRGRSLRIGAASEDQRDDAVQLAKPPRRYVKYRMQSDCGPLKRRTASWRSCWPRRCSTMP